MGCKCARIRIHQISSAVRCIGDECQARQAPGIALWKMVIGVGPMLDSGLLENTSYKFEFGRVVMARYLLLGTHLFMSFRTCMCASV